MLEAESLGTWREEGSRCETRHILVLLPHLVSAGAQPPPTPPPPEGAMPVRAARGASLRCRIGVIGRAVSSA